MATAMSHVFSRASAIAAAAAVFATFSVIDGPYELIGQPPASGQERASRGSIHECRRFCRRSRPTRSVCDSDTLLAWPSTDADATIAACSLDFVRSRLQDRPELRHSWLTRAVVASTLLTSILGVTNQLDPLAQGLKAEYFSDTSGTSP